MRIFPIKQYQTTIHQIELKRLDHGEIQWLTILLAKDPKIKNISTLYKVHTENVLSFIP